MPALSDVLMKRYAKQIDSITGTTGGEIIMEAMARVILALEIETSGDMMKSVYDPKDEGAIRLTPRAASAGAEGTMFYSDADDHVYVATE